MENIIDFFEPEEEHCENAYIDGFEIGNKQGINQGISQGKSEEKIDIAKNMLIDDIDISLISKYTNLSIEKIESLR